VPLVLNFSLSDCKVSAFFYICKEIWQKNIFFVPVINFCKMLIKGKKLDLFEFIILPLPCHQFFALH